MSQKSNKKTSTFFTLFNNICDPNVGEINGRILHTLTYTTHKNIKRHVEKKHHKKFKSIEISLKINSN